MKSVVVVDIFNQWRNSCTEMSSYLFAVDTIVFLANDVVQV